MDHDLDLESENDLVLDRLEKGVRDREREELLVTERVQDFEDEKERDRDKERDLCLSTLLLLLREPLSLAHFLSRLSNFLWNSSIRSSMLLKVNNVA